MTKLAIGPKDNNAYLLRCTATASTLIVDAPAPPDAVVEAVGDAAAVGIVVTHGHADHTAGLEELRRSLGAPVLCHPADADLLPVGPDTTVTDGSTIRCGDVSFTVLHLRGHTPGGIALVYDAAGALSAPHVFVGDSMFPGGPGATRGNQANFTMLMDDLEAKLFALPDATWVYPGHGADTTLGRERPHLPAWRARGW